MEGREIVKSLFGAVFSPGSRVEHEESFTAALEWIHTS
jgi:hypothetical protein